MKRNHLKQKGISLISTFTMVLMLLAMNMAVPEIAEARSVSSVAGCNKLVGQKKSACLLCLGNRGQFSEDSNGYSCKYPGSETKCDTRGSRTKCTTCWPNMGICNHPSAMQPGLSTPDDIRIRAMSTKKVPIIKQSGLVPRLYPDITSISGMRFSGKHVAWGKTIHLYQKDAWRYGGGKCAFYATYEIKNAGNGRVNSYIMNHMYEDSKLIARNYGTLTLNPGEIKKINPAVGLRPGSHIIRVVLDKDKNIAESNETNNIFSVRTILHGTCSKGGSKPPTRPRPELPQGDGRHAK